MAGSSAGLDPGRMAEWLGHGLSSGLLARMLAVPRLEAACGRLLDRRLGPWPQPSHPAPSHSATATIAAMDGLALLGLAQQAGAVWNAGGILRIIDGPSVRALVGVIGPSLRALSIRHAGLAAPPAVQADGAWPSPVDLVGRIAADGLGCVAAWCALQPPALGRRILLRMPCAATADDGHGVHGPAIVDALLEAAA